MTTASELRSGKTQRDENFPVASWIIHPRHRALILAFYNFVRTADDIADHATLGETEKLAYLDLMEAELLGQGDSQPEAVNLRRALAERSMPPRHALDVLIAFRMDVTKLRYENWDEVIHYCRYSAMPVGRFMLDVHGESTSTWAASDALCAGLQINNHLQDCGKDYHNLNRVYLPRDALAAAGASVEALGAARSSAPLLQCLHSLAAKTEVLLNESKSLAAEVKDFRLGLEISVIQAFADKIVNLLKVRDPLSETVHLGPTQLLIHILGGAVIGLLELPRAPQLRDGKLMPGLRRLELGDRLPEGDLIRPRVDGEKQVALMNHLPILEADGHERSADLRAQRNRIDGGELPEESCRGGDRFLQRKTNRHRRRRRRRRSGCRLITLPCEPTPDGDQYRQYADPKKGASPTAATRRRGTIFPRIRQFLDIRFRHGEMRHALTFQQTACATKAALAFLSLVIFNPSRGMGRTAVIPRPSGQAGFCTPIQPRYS